MARASGSQTNREASARVPGPGHYLLRLYVAGSSPKSTQAIEIVKDLCASFPHGNFEYEVIDLHDVPGLAREENIVALPCLVKVHPAPRGTCVGVTADRNRMWI